MPSVNFERVYFLLMYMDIGKFLYYIVFAIFDTVDFLATQFGFPVGINW